MRSRLECALGVVEPYPQRMIFSREFAEQRTGILEMLAVADGACRKRKPLPDIALVRGMYAIGIANVDRDRHCGVHEFQRLPLRVTHRSPILQLV